MSPGMASSIIVCVTEIQAESSLLTMHCRNHMHETHRITLVQWLTLFLPSVEELDVIFGLIGEGCDLQVQFLPHLQPVNKYLLMPTEFDIMKLSLP